MVPVRQLDPLFWPWLGQLYLVCNTMVLVDQLYLVCNTMALVDHYPNPIQPLASQALQLHQTPTTSLPTLATENGCTCINHQTTHTHPRESLDLIFKIRSYFALGGSYLGSHAPTRPQKPTLACCQCVAATIQKESFLSKRPCLHGRNLILGAWLNIPISIAQHQSKILDWRRKLGANYKVQLNRESSSNRATLNL